MTVSMIRSGCRGLPAVALALLAGGLAGCGSGAEKTVPAGGTVTLDGQPLEKGQIGFFPEKGPAADGTIENGKFTLTTYDTPGDGAVPGKHKVSVNATKEVPAPKNVGGGEPQTVSLVAEQYTNPDASGIVITIPPGGDPNIKIEVKSK
jgi:hypothetical protein